MTDKVTKKQLAQYAIARSLFKPKTLQTAIDILGYVQADPIRAPARAQDLIFRHRVKSYRIDDLEKKYPKLDVTEDMLHDHGFFPHRHLPLLYPRKLSPRWQAFVAEHKTLRRNVWNYLNENATAHPRDLEQALGGGNRENGWGSSSSATTLMLECLHREGRARVVRRDSGIRVYSVSLPVNADQKWSSTQRADGLIRMMVNLYAPLPLRSLTQLINMMRHYKPALDYNKRIDAMVKRDELRREIVDGLIYVWPSVERPPQDVSDEVRLLAPFDPIVWDRRRFEHLWGWAYRLEAYTPLAKRKLGYYALPMLWRESVIGWANMAINNGELDVTFGYAENRPNTSTGGGFRAALDAEIERFRQFTRRP